jgi:hypothetical protein
MPLVIWTGQTANTDAFGMLFLALALLRLDDHLRSGETRDLGLCGLFLGLCASAKIWNLLFAPLFAAAVVAFWLRVTHDRKRGHDPISSISSGQTRGHDPISPPSSGVRPAAAEIGIVSPGLAFARGASLTLWALLAYAPWAARAYAFTGDPLYPLLQTRLGDRATADFFRFVATQVRENYGVGRGFLDLLMVGWNVTFRPERFGDLPVGWLLLPLTIFGLVRVRRYPLLYLMLPLSAVAAALWFVTSQQVRYLAPLFPYAAALAAVPVAAAAQHRRWRWLPGAIALLALSGWAPLAAASWPSAGFHAQVPWDSLIGPASRDAVRERWSYNDEWSLWRFANAALPANASILGDGAQARWWAQRAFTDISYDPQAWSAFAAWLKGSGELDYSATHLITTPARARQLGAKLDAAFCRVYSNGSLELWQRRQPSDVCLVPPLASVEPYRWIEVASPRDARGYWWVGARARLLLPRGVAVEVVAPFASVGVRELDVSVNGAAPTRYETDGRRTLTFGDAPVAAVDFVAPQTVNPLDLGFTGDSTPKAFLARVARSAQP